MELILMAGIKKKASRWVFALAGFCIAFSLLSPPAHAFIGVLERRPVSSLERAHRAVWKIQNIGKGFRGTAFAIGRKYFLAAFHTWNGLLKKGRTLGDIHLVQEGNGSTLTVSRLLAVSGTYDIALFEIKGSVEKYLGLAKGSRLEKSQPLSALGYPEGTLAHVGQMWGTRYYENAWLYGFGNYHYTGFGGMSGGPVLNGRGEAIGMQAQSDANVTFAIKLDYLHKLLSSKIGIACSRPFMPG